jgi:multiple sugar transport system ATP-binding protein
MPTTSKLWSANYQRHLYKSMIRKALFWGCWQHFDAPIDLHNYPANKFVAGFIGPPKMNFLEVTTASPAKDAITVSSGDLEATNVPVKADDLAQGAALTLGVRRKSMKLANGKSARLNSCVTLFERLGLQTYIEV